MLSEYNINRYFYSICCDGYKYAIIFPKFYWDWNFSSSFFDIPQIHHTQTGPITVQIGKLVTVYLFVIFIELEKVNKKMSFTHNNKQCSYDIWIDKYLYWILFYFASSICMYRTHAKNKKSQLWILFFNKYISTSSLCTNQILTKLS